MNPLFVNVIDENGGSGFQNCIKEEEFVFTNYAGGGHCLVFRNCTNLG